MKCRIFFKLPKEDFTYEKKNDRKHNIGNSTFYKWREKYGGMEASDIKRLKELEEENRRLKQMYAELSLKSQLQEDVIKSCSACFGA